MKQTVEQAPGKEASSFPVTGNAYTQFVLPLIIFVSVSFLLYLPVLDHYFVSDDFKVLYRVCLERIIFIKNFFRPLSDISIYLNYRMGGLDPRFFNSFNILIHGMNGYLVYMTCLFFSRNLEKTKRVQFAVISSALFLTYPFHNEGVVWLLGRGASMACLFSLLSILGFYTVENNILKYTSVCISYFISIAAFESTLLFPLIFILLLVFEKQNDRTIRSWVILLTLTFFVHLIGRMLISGSILGSYGNDFFQTDIRSIISNMAKVGGRLVLPPSKNPVLLTSLFFMLAAISGFYFFRNLRQIRRGWTRSFVFILTIMLFISCVVPVITGISTQTTESDRMLYFPSVFLCMIGGWLLTRIKKSEYRWLLFALIISYNLFFLEWNNLNWKRASAVTWSIMSKIQELSRSEKQEGKVYFLNIPNEINGSYVFRLGFSDALRLYGEDSSRFVAVNYLPRQDLDKITKKTELRPDGELNLPPDIVLKPDSSGCRQIYDHGKLKYAVRPGDRIYFCNPYQLESIQACMNSE